MSETEQLFWFTGVFVVVFPTVFFGLLWIFGDGTT
jgi:hypothetical protein